MWKSSDLGWIIAGPGNLIFACLVCYLLCHVQLFATPSTVPCQAPLSMEFFRQEYWSGLPIPFAGHLSNPGIKLRLLHYRQILYHLSYQGSPACMVGKYKFSKCSVALDRWCIIFNLTRWLNLLSLKHMTLWFSWKKKKKENLFKKIIKFLLIKKKPEKELSWKRGRWHTNSFVGGGRGWEPRRAGGLEDWKRQGNILP